MGRTCTTIKIGISLEANENEAAMELKLHEQIPHFPLDELWGE